MDRNRYPVSIVPYPIDRPASEKGLEVDENSAWDSKWLRPRLAVPKIAGSNGEVPSVAIIEKSRSEMAARTTIREEKVEEQEEVQPSLPLRVLRWLFPEVNQRRAIRYPTPGLVAYYWTGGAPHSYHVGDMSATGLFLLTKDRWAPGTLIQMTLQRQDGKTHGSENSICLLSEVVRWGEDGSGFNFVLTDYENVQSYGILPGEATDRKSVERFLVKVAGQLPR